MSGWHWRLMLLVEDGNWSSQTNQNAQMQITLSLVRVRINCQIEVRINQLIWWVYIHLYVYIQKSESDKLLDCILSVLFRCNSRCEIGQTKLRRHFGFLRWNLLSKVQHWSSTTVWRFNKAKPKYTRRPWAMQVENYTQS